MEQKESYEEWISGFEGLSFEEYAVRVKNKILESPELDKKSKAYFTDAFNYVMGLHKANKPLDTNLMRIHMTEVKNYTMLTLNDFTKVLLMLSLCGFQFDFCSKENKT